MSKAKNYIEAFKASNPRTYWTPEEISLLRDLVAGGVTSAQWIVRNVPELKHRSAVAVSVKMCYLRDRGGKKQHG